MFGGLSVISAAVSELAQIALPYSFTLANGAHYVSTGLIAQLQSEAELAALIALPLAALCRGDADKLQAGERQRVLSNLVPNLLVVTLTAGLGAKSLGRAQEKETEDQRIRLRDASDAVALQWLTAAGFEATAADTALRRLVDGLPTIDCSGTGEFSRPLELMSRRDALRRSASGPDGGGAEAVRTPAAPTAADAGFRALSRRYALALARADVNSHPSSLPAWLARIDRRDGPSGYTAFLRAELARRNSGTNEGATAAIRAYETCVGFADAPVAAYRELGFLLQRTGASDRARQAFET